MTKFKHRREFLFSEKGGSTEPEVCPVTDRSAGNTVAPPTTNTHTHTRVRAAPGVSGSVTCCGLMVSQDLSNRTNREMKSRRWEEEEERQRLIFMD